MSEFDHVMNLLQERFGKDVVLSLATLNGDKPAVRNVNGYYEDGAFYTVTYEKSDKMQQIMRNPHVAVDVCLCWFTASGIGENLGWVRDDANADMMKKLRAAFAQWYDNGHTNEDDPHTCLLRIKLTSGVLFDQGTKYKIDFVNHTV